MLTLVSSVPASLAGGVYLDDPLILTFSDVLAAATVTGDMFRLYRTDETLSEVYDAFAVVVSQDAVDGRIVTLTHSAAFLPETYYVLSVVGGTDGVRTISDDTLEGNLVLQFRTGTTIRPVSATPSDIGEVQIQVGGVDVPNTVVVNPSNDLFSSSGDAAPIALLSTIPAHQSVGIKDIAAVVLTYNDDIATHPATNVFSLEWHTVPIDLDPFADNRITVTSSTVSGRQINLDVEDTTDTVNREYVLRVSANIVKGVNRKAYDGDSHEIRFMGPLTPLYALPEQVRRRLASFIDGASVKVSDYELYKLIHEKSLWLRDELKMPVDTLNLTAANRIVICMVLKELFTYGAILGGQIKSRELLLTRIEYNPTNMSDAVDALDACIKEGLAAITDMQHAWDVHAGIRGVNYLNRPTKLYNATYR